MAAILSPPAPAIWTWLECKLHTKLNINHDSASSFAIFSFYHAVSCFVYCFNNVVLSFHALDTKAKQFEKLKYAYIEYTFSILCATWFTIQMSYAIP
jgi:hypothetical protein